MSAFTQARKRLDLQPMKLFQFGDFWKSRLAPDSADRIERTIEDRSRRLIAGIAVDPNFETASGSLVVARGRGKFCRVLFHDHASAEIPAALRETCLRLTQNAAPSCDELKSCGMELADLHCVVVDRLKQKAARYVDRILAVSITDPGIWTKDFDSKLLYQSLSDPTRVAEKTGITVIDAFPARDMEVGGNGKPLDLLPWWLLLSDRSFPVSSFVNARIRVAEKTSIVLFAPSDGLDATVPDIIRFETRGMNFVDALARIAFQTTPKPEQLRNLLISSVHSKALLKAWHQAAEHERSGEAMFAVAKQAIEKNLDTEQLFSTFSRWIVETCERSIQSGLAELKRNFDLEKKKAEANRKGKAVAQFQHPPKFDRVGMAFLDANSPFRDVLSSMLRNQSGIEVKTQLELAESPSTENYDNHDSLVAALLGLLHVDQIPANVPMQTGAHQQRILGRLTPGRPHQWRQLLREMSDFQPPALKLRDAV